MTCVCTRGPGREKERSRERNGPAQAAPRLGLSRRRYLLDVGEEGQGSFLEHQPRRLGGGVISELGNPVEGDGLGKTKSCVWGMWSSNACGDPGSEVPPQGCGFS